MKTYLDCIPCFFRQALESARLSGVDELKQKEVLNELARALPSMSLDNSPPEIGRYIYNLVKIVTGNDDPFKKLKKKSNYLSLELYPELKEKIKNSSDKLLTALRLAIAGNVIDYGVPTSFQLDEELENILHKKFAFFDYKDFKKELQKTDRILYLADNAGETVFDRLLIETLREFFGCSGKEIIYAVRGRAIINDALMEDALDCGLDKVAKVISSGSDAPGTIPKYCSEEFQKIYEQAEFIISKGQGNFESLEGENKLIFFLFKAKCSVIARDINCEVGDIILKRGDVNADL